MRLYAITTGTDTSKGVGDNNRLEIELKHKNKRFAVINFEVYGDKIYLDITKNREILYSLEVND